VGGSPTPARNRYGADVEVILSRPYNADDLVVVVRAMLGEDLRSVPSMFPR
jgi:hypothetical protein